MQSYPLRPTRRALDLCGLWDFAWLGDADPAALDPSRIVFDEVEAVPGVFDAGVARCGARGTGVYRCRVPLATTAGTMLRVHVGALGLWGRLWWDGRPLGDAELPYTAYSFDVPGDGAAEHELVIAVDNRFDAERTPTFPPYSDFYAYGGIYRGVSVEELPALRIERVRVTTAALSPPRVALDVRLSGQVPEELALRLAFDSGPAEELTVRPVDGVVSLTRDLPGAGPWSPEQPELHTVMVGTGGDCLVERFGLRTIEARDGAIWLNGERIRLVGVNRHEAHPQLGPAQPAALLVEDARLLRDLGCNFVRLVHYPHDPAFLDLCDQVGLLVWEETLGWQIPAAALADARTQALLHDQVERMVASDANHPSIVLWAFLNESASDSEAAVPVYQSLADTIRAIDPTRLVTWASNRGAGDRCLASADVVSLNIYPGWFSPRADWTGSYLDVMAPHIAGIAAFCDRPDLVGKPLLISEIGACGLYGCHDRGRAQWSEEFQSDYMGEACRAILGDARFSGLALWQFGDTRSYVNAGDIRGKPRGYNCAGLVDDFRRPKLAYDTVRAHYTAERRQHRSD